MTYYCQNCNEHPSNKPIEIKQTDKTCPECKKEIDWARCTTFYRDKNMVGTSTRAVYPIEVKSL